LLLHKNRLSKDYLIFSCLDGTRDLLDGTRDLPDDIRDLLDGKRDLPDDIRDLPDGTRDLPDDIRDLPDDIRDLLTIRNKTFKRRFDKTPLNLFCLFKIFLSSFTLNL
jgi:hypothetical protein